MKLLHPEKRPHFCLDCGCDFMATTDEYSEVPIPSFCPEHRNGDHAKRLSATIERIMSELHNG